MDDRIEVENWFDPLQGDADHDGRLDLQEFAEGTNPRVYNKHGGDYVAAFLKGFMAGDFIRDTQDPTVMAGQLIGSFVPFIDVRDVAANTIHLDAGMTGLSLIGLIPVVGDATGAAGKCVKYVSKFADNPSVVLELLTFLEKNCPDIAKEVTKSDDFIPAMEKLAKSDLSKLTKAEREALEELYEKNGLKELIKGGSVSSYEVTWNKSINATQEMIEGTSIPRSFTLNGQYVNGKEDWVHGNATKHMGEYVNSANGSLLVENELMISFQDTVSQILPKVQSGRNFFYINGWKIGINGDTGVIYHALYK